MDDVTAGKRSGTGNGRVAHRYVADPVALALDHRATPAEDRSGNPAAVLHLAVCGVDDRVDFQESDVRPDQLNLHG